jgi:hypothetical protein
MEGTNILEDPAASNFTAQDGCVMILDLVQNIKALISYNSYMTLAHNSRTDANLHFQNKTTA